MSTGVSGTQSHLMNEPNPQGNQSHSLPSAATTPEALAPDQPPRPLEGASKPRRPRGFAAMDRKLVSEIARKGGKAAHSAGTAHEFTSEEARVAGRKGGRATHAKRRRSSDEGSADSSSNKTGGPAA